MEEAWGRGAWRQNWSVQGRRGEVWVTNLKSWLDSGPDSGFWDMGDLGSSVWEGNCCLGQKLGFRKVPEKMRA